MEGEGGRGNKGEVGGGEEESGFRFHGEKAQEQKMRQ